MNRLSYTLVSDGSTDANLIPIIDWTLRQAAGVEITNGTRAEFWRLPIKPGSLEERIVQAVDLYPCDALFIHRDSETEAHANRFIEIRSAFERAAERIGRLPAVALIPVRMTEAWLLFNERAIREASGNPNGTLPLNLPPLNRLEDRPDPKADLCNALRIASELRGRRLKKFNDAQAVRRMVDFLTDFSALRSLSAFVAFEHAVGQMRDKCWSPGLYPLPS